VALSPETPRINQSLVVSLGKFEVDFQSGVLSGNGTKVFLQGQSLHLLELLVQHPGRVVTREQIRLRLWPDGTIVEFEHSVNAAVKRLREALGDDAEKPCYIETVPRRGYRLIAPVAPVLQPAKPGTHGRVSTLRSVLSRRALTWSGLAAVLLMLAGGLLLGYRWSRPTRPVPSTDSPVVLQRLTDFVGTEESPAVSPDGKSLAFSAGADTPHIWVRLLSGGSPLKITRDNVAHLYPRWSPDSVSLIYFTPGKGTAMEGGIYEIPALGGSPRRLASSFTGGDLSHDGKRLAYFRREGSKLELVVTDRDGSKPRVLALLAQEYDYGLPRWSPDDRHIAYRRGRVFDYEIFTIPSAGGESRQITHDLKLLAGYSWLPDGSGIVCSSSRNTTSLYLPTLDLFSARLEGGPLRQLTFGDTSFLDPDVDDKGRVYVSQQRRDSNIWKFSIDGSPAENVRRAVQVTNQTAEVETPSLSPDGREMVYLSEFGGHSNLWVKKLDGSAEPRQITFERNPDVAVGVPVWSPDGRHITFFTRRRDTRIGDQWVISPDGSNLRQLVPEGGWAAWSNDGKWLYVSPQREEGRLHTITKIPVDGGEAIEVRADESFIGAASVPDGNTLYFVRMRSRAPGNQDVEIHRASPENGPSKIIARIPARRWPLYYLVQPVASPDGKWLAVMLADVPATNLYVLPTAGGPMRQVTDFGKAPTEIPRRVSWSPDSKHIYAAVTRVDADVVALTNLLQRD
jgi:Tol biopolymer transport system component/DNA-binding winged helix-turn-helix (wHTH) protein